MSKIFAPKIDKPDPIAAPARMDDPQAQRAREEAVRQARSKGLASTVLTPRGGLPGANTSVKQLLGQ